MVGLQAAVYQFFIFKLEVIIIGTILYKVIMITNLASIVKEIRLMLGIL